MEGTVKISVEDFDRLITIDKVFREKVHLKLMYSFGFEQSICNYIVCTESEMVKALKDKIADQNDDYKRLENKFNDLLKEKKSWFKKLFKQ
jgi:hypothetical protein